jgi:uncharacterized membrane protein YfcA
VAAVELATGAWLLLALAAFLVGFAKTAIGGVAALAVVIFASVLPARESTGALLPLLLCGDLVAVTYYRRHADLATLLRLLPGVLPGLALRAVFIAVVDNRVMVRSIGLVLLVMTGLHLWQRRARRTGPLQVAASHPHVLVTLLVGLAAGFATMTANAAGAVMTIYLIVAGLRKLELLATGAWFFLAVNLAKVPFSAGLDLISPESLVMDALLVPAMLAGAAVGVAVIRRVSQQGFELAALGLTAVASLLLLLW